MVQATTTGKAPLKISSHCIAVVKSSQKSFEIFVYGSYGSNTGPLSLAYDTIDILTLPTFHWISVPYQPEKPRQGHTCHPVGDSQTISVGGADPNWKGGT